MLCTILPEETALVRSFCLVSIFIFTLATLYTDPMVQQIALAQSRLSVLPAALQAGRRAARSHGRAGSEEEHVHVPAAIKRAEDQWIVLVSPSLSPFPLPPYLLSQSLNPTHIIIHSFFLTGSPVCFIMASFNYPEAIKSAWGCMADDMDDESWERLNTPASAEGAATATESETSKVLGLLMRMTRLHDLGLAQLCFGEEEVDGGGDMEEREEGYGRGSLERERAAAVSSS